MNFDASSEELKERALRGKIKLILNPGVSNSAAFATRRRITDQSSTGALGDWPRGLKVKKEDEHPKRNSYSQELDKMFTWFRRAGVAEQIKPEWGPPVSVIKMKGGAQTTAMFQSSTGWTNEESALQQILPHASAKELQEDLEDMSSRCARRTRGSQDALHLGLECVEVQVCGHFRGQVVLLKESSQKDLCVTQ